MKKYEPRTTIEDNQYIMNNFETERLTLFILAAV